MVYHDHIVRYYDYMIQGVEHDIDFYTDFFKDFKGKILEIGAGTGRITIPLAKEGLDITAMDISEEMLTMLRYKALQQKIKIPSIVADMRTFDLYTRNNIFHREIKVETLGATRFDSIVISFRAFQHLYTVEDQMKTLEKLKDYLALKGSIVFDVYNPQPLFMMRGDWKWQEEKSIQLPGKEGKSIMDFRNIYNQAKQIMIQQFRFRHSDGTEEIFPIKMRYFYRFEIEHLLKIAGYKVVQLYGDFCKRKFKSNSPEMIWIVRRG